jgi:hypothetical protein
VAWSDREMSELLTVSATAVFFCKERWARGVALVSDMRGGVGSTQEYRAVSCDRQSYERQIADGATHPDDEWQTVAPMTLDEALDCHASLNDRMLSWPAVRMDVKQNHVWRWGVYALFSLVALSVR